MGKVIIFSAPSGSGKSTLINHLLRCGLDLAFSISATSRAPRGEEKDGCEYYFFSVEEFRRRKDNQEFLEWEEVYPGLYYGTLKSEVERIWSQGASVLFDVDVIGGLNIKKTFGDRALAIFVQAPSIEELRRRLLARGTDTPEKIEQRIAKAAYEMSFADQFDLTIVNDTLEHACQQAEQVIRDFLHRP